MPLNPFPKKRPNHKAPAVDATDDQRRRYTREEILNLSSEEYGELFGQAMTDALWKVREEKQAERDKIKIKKGDMSSR